MIILIAQTNTGQRSIVATIPRPVQDWILTIEID